MKYIYPKVKNFKKIIPFMLLGALIASIYGAAHDQLSYLISPEYFTEFKFKQFSFADFSMSNRAYVSLVGVLATWWFGVLCGWFLGRVRYYREDLVSAKKDIISGFFIIFFVVILASALGGIIGYIRAYHLIINTFLGWEDVMTHEKLKPFVVVSFIHASGYLGGFAGIIYASQKMK